MGFGAILVFNLGAKIKNHELGQYGAEPHLFCYHSGNFVE